VLSPEQVDEEYTDKLLEGIFEQHAAIKEALTEHNGRCLCYRLAAFVLHEVGWDVGQFLEMEAAGVFDE